MKRVVFFILIAIILASAAVVLLWPKFNQGQSIVAPFFNSKERIATQNEKEEQPVEPVFKNLGPAPEFAGITKWFNTEPIRMADLAGKVVLIDFWTYSCINCINSFPHLNKWYQEYKDQGFAIVGVHTPEFAFEKVTNNVEAALKRYKINYPIAQDNNYKTWSAYNNQFWPARYLIDKKGDIVYTHFGEGSYEITEKAIRKVMGLEGEFQPPTPETPSQAGTPTTYLGSIRWNNFGGSETPSSNEQIYAFPKNLAKNRFALEGKWKIEQEAAVHTQGFGRIRINFNAAKVFMVAESTEANTIKIYVDGKLQKGVTIINSDLYPLYESSAPANHTMEVEFPKGGVSVFSFTFN
ncbi:thioredoxin family protein [bacterium]|nr:MAG: thioredoxin family protein [bacterium]